MKWLEDFVTRSARSTLFIHGGCHGAWAWRTVIDGLSARGVESIAIDLPGCGSDPTPRQDVSVATEVSAALSAIDAIPTHDVRVVGHSIGGWLLPRIAASRPDRVFEIVFLAAAALNRGERGIDITPKERQAGYFEMAAASPDNSLLPPFDDARRRFFTNLNDDAARAAYAQLTPQAFAPYLEPAAVGIEDVGVDRRYLATSDDLTYPQEFTDAFADKAGVVPELIPGDHCVMLSDPEVVVDALS